MDREITSASALLSVSEPTRALPMEHWSTLALSLATVAGIVVVAYTDYVVVSPIPLGYLYVFPLALSALVHRQRTTLLLVLICVVLQDWLGPFHGPGGQWVARNLVSFGGFYFVALVVHQLGRQRAELLDMVRAQRDELTRELELAAEIQSRLLPREAPRVRGYDLAAQLYSAKLVTGDYYDWLELGPGRLGVVIADVSGKGAAAGLLMPSVELALRLEARNSAQPGTILKNMNRILAEIVGHERFVSLFLAVLDTERQELCYANAGHVPPILRRASGEVEWLDRGGIVLGVLPEVEYEEARVQLEPGDTLVFYTDGAVEAENPEGVDYSRERLAAFVGAQPAQTAAELVEAIHASVLSLRAGVAPEDDITLVVLHVEPENQTGALR